MDVVRVINDRRSVRAYLNKPVPKEAVQTLLDAAVQAPSVMNSQPWRFHALTGDARDRIIGIISKSSWHVEELFDLLNIQEREESVQQAAQFFADLGGAPVIIVVTMPKITHPVLLKMSGISCGMAVQNMMLAAHAEGLATCCIGSSLWVDDELMKELGIEDSYLVTVLAVGYPERTPNAPPRRKDVVEWEGF